MPGAFTERSRHFFNSDNSVFNMTEINSDLFERMTIAAANDTWLKKTIWKIKLFQKRQN